MLLKGNINLLEKETLTEKEDSLENVKREQTEDAEVENKSNIIC